MLIASTLLPGKNLITLHTPNYFFNIKGTPFHLTMLIDTCNCKYFYFVDHFHMVSSCYKQILHNLIFCYSIKFKSKSLIYKFNQNS